MPFSLVKFGSRRMQLRQYIMKELSNNLLFELHYTTEHIYLALRWLSGVLYDLCNLSFPDTISFIPFCDIAIVQHFSWVVIIFSKWWFKPEISIKKIGFIVSVNKYGLCRVLGQIITMNVPKYMKHRLLLCRNKRGFPKRRRIRKNKMRILQYSKESA